MTLKLVLLIAVAYMLYRMFDSEKRKKKEQETQDQQHRVDTGELVKDPVCGAYVEAESAISVRDGNTKQCFCSYDCRDTFLRQHEIPQETVTVEEPAAEAAKKDGDV